MTRTMTLALWMLLLVCTDSQAALVTNQLGTSSSILEPFHELNFPSDPAVGTQVTEIFGADVLQTNHFVTVLYDPAFFSVQSSDTYHAETATVGTRVHEYVGFFDPDTNELLNASWQVISEDLFEQSFQVGSSTQFLVQTGGGPDDPPPPPPQVVPLPSPALLLACALVLGTSCKRRGASI